LQVLLLLGAEALHACGVQHGAAPRWQKAMDWPTLLLLLLLGAGPMAALWVSRPRWLHQPTRHALSLLLLLVSQARHTRQLLLLLLCGRSTTPYVGPTQVEPIGRTHALPLLA
jgi:hypothetical protein